LRALHQVCAKEVAAALNGIFVDFGCTSILHTDNGPEFRNALIEELDVSGPLPGPLPQVSWHLCIHTCCGMWAFSSGITYAIAHMS
jgi:hypothetical protein